MEAYSELNVEQRQQLQAKLSSEQYEQVRPFMITTYERGKLDGKAEGKLEGKAEGKLEGKLEGMVEERRKMALLLLDAKFGPLPEAVRERVVELPAEELRQLLLDLVKAQTLAELRSISTDE